MFKKYLFANFQDLDLHISGLRRMIELRGGLQGLGATSLLLPLVIWYTYTSALKSGKLIITIGPTSVRPQFLGCMPDLRLSMMPSRRHGCSKIS